MISAELNSRDLQRSGSERLSRRVIIHRETAAHSGQVKRWTNNNLRRKVCGIKGVLWSFLVNKQKFSVIKHTV